MCKQPFFLFRPVTFENEINLSAASVGISGTCVTK